MMYNDTGDGVKRTIIKMNVNENHLSLGILLKYIKEISKNKSSALQTELFAIIYEVNNVNDTTVNNYCVGIRSIKDDYRQNIINKLRRYEKDKEIFCSNIIGIISIVEGKYLSVGKDKIEYINENPIAKDIVYKMYNISKNDIRVPVKFINELSDIIKLGNYYEAFIKIIEYVTLKNKQPLYEDDISKEEIEDLIDGTYMSYKGLTEYLALKFRESINYDYTLKKLSENNNAYASFELGSEEYCGNVYGYPRYEMAYKYLKIASEQNHAGAIYLIGNMLYKGYIGTKSNEDLEEAYNYFKKAESLGNIASKNCLGNMYLNGTFPVKKNKNIAIKYYQEAANYNYAFAINNLGRIYEFDKDYDKAFEYYLKSANLKESWACNKVGQCLRLGYMTSQNKKEAFKYYKWALESNHRTLCYYAYYNLAKYYYVEGYKDLYLAKDLEKAIKYYKIAGENGIIEALIELVRIYISKYMESYENIYKKEIFKYVNLIEINENYNDEIKKQVEEMVENIKKNHKITIDLEG